MNTISSVIKSVYIWLFTIDIYEELKFWSSVLILAIVTIIVGGVIIFTACMIVFNYHIWMGVIMNTISSVMKSVYIWVITDEIEKKVVATTLDAGLISGLFTIILIAWGSILYFIVYMSIEAVKQLCKWGYYEYNI